MIVSINYFNLTRFIHFIDDRMLMPCILSSMLGIKNGNPSVPKNIPIENQGQLTKCNAFFSTSFISTFSGSWPSNLRPSFRELLEIDRGLGIAAAAPRHATHAPACLLSQRSSTSFLPSAARDPFPMAQAIPTCVFFFQLVF
jgi:hypothetical protein